MATKKTQSLAGRIVTELHDVLGGPTPASAAHARYVGARGHEERAPNEQSVLDFWGHKVPLLRMAFRSVHERCELSSLHVSPADAFDVWRAVWDSSNVFEIKSIALSQITADRLIPHRRAAPAAFFDLASEADNWAHSDEFSSVFAEILENDPKHLPVFERWNTARNPWLRRQSIVGLYCYARSRSRPLPVSKALPLVRNLLDDPHFYVQRGVGWTLREIDRVDSIKQRRFVRKHLSSISPVAWFAASELYGAELRGELARTRKELRQRDRRR